MSFDYALMVRKKEVFSGEMTSNLRPMVIAAGLYDAIYNPSKLGVVKGGQLAEHLERGLETLKNDPEKFKALNPVNKWGSYDHLVETVEKYLAACKSRPRAKVWVCG